MNPTTVFKTFLKISSFIFVVAALLVWELERSMFPIAAANLVLFIMFMLADISGDIVKLRSDIDSLRSEVKRRGQNNLHRPTESRRYR